MRSMRPAVTVAAVSLSGLLFGLLPEPLHFARPALGDGTFVDVAPPEGSGTSISGTDAVVGTKLVDGPGKTVLTSMVSEEAGPAATEALQTSTSQDGEQYAFRPVLQEPVTPSPFKENQDSRVKVKIYPYFDRLQRGGKCPIAIELTIAEGWHINANPANSEFAIPTEVKITSKQKIKMTKIKYPQHELLQVDGQDDPSHVYGGRVIIYAMLEISAEEAADEAELEVEVKVQACNEKTCEPPETKKLIGKRPLANSGDEIKRIHESKFPKDDARDQGKEEKVDSM